MLTPIDFVAAQPRVLDIAAYLEGEQVHEGIRILPYEPAVGALVRGLRVKPGEPIAEATAELLRRKLLARGFLVFEPGTVTAADFITLVGLFGEAQFYGTPYTPSPEENGRINTIDSKIKHTRMNYIWHSDGSYRDNPPTMTALYAHTVPEYGGDTVFANAAAAYDLLDPPFAAYLETLTSVQSAETVGHLPLSYQDPEELARQRAKNPPIESPVIRVHPETGRKVVNVNESYTMRIKGVSRVVSQNLLNILFDLIKSTEIQARLRWEQGTAVIWDNRTVQHRGVDDYGNARRVLYRAVLA